MANIFKFLSKDGNITPEKARKSQQMQLHIKTAYVWMGILPLKKHVNRDKFSFATVQRCLGSLLSMRSLAIDDPRYTDRALCATLYVIIFNDHRQRCTVLVSRTSSARTSKPWLRRRKRSTSFAFGRWGQVAILGLLASIFKYIRILRMEWYQECWHSYSNIQILRMIPRKTPGRLWGSRLLYEILSLRQEP